MPPINEIKVISEYNRIAQIQRNSGLPVDRVAIAGLVAANLRYPFKDVLAVMEDKL